ncbi:MAG: hypothetical protein JXA89_20995 [Anaerolineae bacterium]|nr:hypothetical protein [Anaerolineae bacterium]
MKTQIRIVQVLVALALIVSVLAASTDAAVAQEPVPAGLMLWNELGSDDQVFNSAFGPGLEFYTGGGGLEVQGDREYVPGKYSNGVTLKGTYGNMDRIHNLVLDNVGDVIDPERGTVELWYYQTAVPVAYSYGVYRLFDGSFGLGSGMGLFAVPDGIVFELRFDGQRESIQHDYANVPNNEWIHVAATWDRAGIDGTLETMRLYINGEKVEAAMGNGWGTTVGQRADICGGNDHNIIGKFEMDSLKIWNYAKTDFAEFVATPHNLQVYPDDSIAVELDIANASDLYAAQSACAVDPVILEIQSSAWGDLFANPLIGINEIDGAAGTWFGGLSLQNPAEPISGSSRLATLTYQALSHGQTTLTCDPLFSDRDGFGLLVTAYDTEITVLEYGTVEGVATYQGRLDHLDIAITAAGPTAVVESTDNEGRFELGQLRHGSYTIQADAPRYLCRSTEVEITGGPVVLPDTILLGGDANDDNEINIGDATLVAANFGLTVPPADERADINGDGVVNIQDLAILGGNFGQVGCLDW